MSSHNVSSDVNIHKKLTRQTTSNTQTKRGQPSFTRLYPQHLFTCSRVGTVAGNVSLLPAVVTSLVSRRFCAVSRDVPHLSAVEAPTVLSSRLVDNLSIVSLETWILTLASNVTRLTTVVASLFSGATATTKSAASTLLSGSSLSFLTGRSSRRFCTFLFRHGFVEPYTSPEVVGTRQNEQSKELCECVS